LSPEFSGGTNQDSYSMNIWNQINFGYNYGGKLKFHVIPRWTMFLNAVPSSKDGDADNGPGNRGMFVMEDWLIAFSGVVASSEDKKWNLWIRPGLRLPTSRPSNNDIHGTYGQVSHQPEFFYILSYNPNNTWEFALQHQMRFW